MDTASSFSPMVCINKILSQDKTLDGKVCFVLLEDILMSTIFKVCIEFVKMLLLFYVLDFWPQGIWSLSSLHPLEGEVLTIRLPGRPPDGKF